MLYQSMVVGWGLDQTRSNPLHREGRTGGDVFPFLSPETASRRWGVMDRPTELARSKWPDLTVYPPDHGSGSSGADGPLAAAPDAGHWAPNTGYWACPEPADSATAMDVLTQ